MVSRRAYDIVRRMVVEGLCFVFNLWLKAPGMQQSRPCNVLWQWFNEWESIRPRNQKCVLEIMRLRQRKAAASTACRVREDAKKMPNTPIKQT